MVPEIALMKRNYELLFLLTVDRNSDEVLSKIKPKKTVKKKKASQWILIPGNFLKKLGRRMTQKVLPQELGREEGSVSRSLANRAMLQLELTDLKNNL